MVKREANTDLWVYDMLKDVDLDKSFSAQGSTIKEINEALSTASKKGTGRVGFPEYVGVVKDFLIVIENKADTNKHVKRDVNGLIKADVKSVTDYAANGALFYGLHLSKNTSYRKIIALGISGNEKNHMVSQIFVDERGNYRELKELETVVSFREDNIIEYYEREILECKTDDTLKTEEVLKIAKDLHEDLRNYGNLEDKNKPLIISGILLKHFTEILYNNIFTSISYNNSAEDYIGRFYGEFMSYSGGDGQTLGIILTPKHITELFCDLLDLKPEDKVIDPCCGSRVIIMVEANSSVKSKVLKFLPKLKTEEIISWCAV